MQAFIRISPNISETANDFAKDKEQMVLICHTSFLAVGGYPVKKHYILDNCPERWQKYFAKFGEVTVINSGVKRDTITKMFEIAREKATEEVLLFLEDDYLWNNQIRLESLEAAVKHFGAVAPYDHPGHYRGLNKSHYIEEFNGALFRNCVTTTHTFAVTKELFLEHFDSFNFGQHDWIMWNKLASEGVNLFSPLVSYSTHLAKGLEAHHYDWKLFFDGLADNVDPMDKLIGTS